LTSIKFIKISFKSEKKGNKSLIKKAKKTLKYDLFSTFENAFRTLENIGVEPKKNFKKLLTKQL